MNNLNDEQRNRLEQIRAVRETGALPWSHLSSPTQQFQLAGEVIDLLLSLIDSKAAEGDGYWPMIVDRGDGVKGHYCIGRLIKQGEAFWEYWSKGEWGSAGEVFIGHDAAEAQLEAIRKGIGYADPLDNDAVDNELRRWQDAIRDKLIDLGAPDWKIDGAGCDSGDPLDFTLAEVGQGCGWFIDKADSAASAMRDKCVEAARARIEQWKRDIDGTIQQSRFAANLSAKIEGAQEIIVKLQSLTLEEKQQS